jgi:Fe-Mn family superoxide dismutase
MAFSLPDLPYPKDALGEYMSAETLEFHHGKHHRAYVDKTNDMLADRKVAGASLTELIRDAGASGDSKLFNNSAQLWNHSFFWQCLCPPAGQRPTGRLAELIDDAFGSSDAMLAKVEGGSDQPFLGGWYNWCWTAASKSSRSTTPTRRSSTRA